MIGFVQNLQDENEKLKGKIKQFEEEISQLQILIPNNNLYPERNFDAIKKSYIESQEEIGIMGISMAGPIHAGLDFFVDFLKNHKTLKILICHPDSKYLNKLKVLIPSNDDPNSYVLKRLTKPYIIASFLFLQTLHNMVPDNYIKNMEIRLYRKRPRHSIIHIDQKKVIVSDYIYDGDKYEKNILASSESEMRILSCENVGERQVQKYINVFTSFWDDKKTELFDIDSVNYSIDFSVKEFM